MEINLDSWRKAAAGFASVEASAPRSLSDAVASTTNPAACGADGPSTVDAAVGIALTAFSALMQEGFIPSLQEGLASETDALAATRNQLRDMEDENLRVASQAREMM